MKKIKIQRTSAWIVFTTLTIKARGEDGRWHQRNVTAGQDIAQEAVDDRQGRTNSACPQQL